MKNYKNSQVKKSKKPAILRGLVALVAIVSVMVLVSNTFSKAQERPLPRTSSTEKAIKNSSLAGQATTDWNLTLVNPWHSIDETREFTIGYLDNNAADERILPELQEMMEACAAAGNSPLIISSYRTQEVQEGLYQNKVNQLIAQGSSEKEAKTEAAKVVALPGTSEHQLGLAVDIVDVNNTSLTDAQEETPVQQWLMENSWRYGFILRYPTDKTEITGIIYEPWHYRYVGKTAAEYIYDNDICLEEYLELL